VRIAWAVRTVSPTATHLWILNSCAAGSAHVTRRHRHDGGGAAATALLRQQGAGARAAAGSAAESGAHSARVPEALLPLQERPGGRPGTLHADVHLPRVQGGASRIARGGYPFMWIWHKEHSWGDSVNGCGSNPSALAEQAEESYISADDFCRAVQQESAVVLQNEVTLLQGLRFDLVVRAPSLDLPHSARTLCLLNCSLEGASSHTCTPAGAADWRRVSAADATCVAQASKLLPSFAAQVHHPLWSLQGFFADFDAWRTDAGSSADAGIRAAPAASLQQAHGAAKTALGAVMQTDAPLLHPPGLLALAAMRSGFQQVSRAAVEWVYFLCMVLLPLHI